MLYKLHSLSKEDLQRLYVEERRKLMFAMVLDMPHNSIQSFKLNLKHIDSELTKRRPKIERSKARPI